MGTSRRELHGFLVLVAFLLSGCLTGLSKLEDASFSAGGIGSDEGLAFFQDNLQTELETGCGSSSCHGGGQEPAFLSGSTDQSRYIATLVEIRKGGDDPTASKLYERISSDHGSISCATDAAAPCSDIQTWWQTELDAEAAEEEGTEEEEEPAT